MFASTSVVSTRRCTLASHELDLRNIKVHAHLKFLVSGQSKQASKQASKHRYTHACAMKSHYSVGLTQARPNNCSFAGAIVCVLTVQPLNKQFVETRHTECKVYANSFHCILKVTLLL